MEAPDTHIGEPLAIEVKNLVKRFEERLVLDRVDLEIRDKEFIGLLGPSGSGKTTLLRILAGLESADEGRVEIDGRDSRTLSVDERRIGFVFQHYALFNHMTAFDNVAFGLEVKRKEVRKAPSAIAERVHELLALVQLDDFADRFPAQLSGGQRQRVALARTLAIDPKVLLLDEPFGALDAKVRVELRRSLRDIHDAAGLTTVFVTHDQAEALDLADRVAIMNKGIIEQVGTPVEIYDSPKSPFVFDFLGHTNSFNCIVRDGKAYLADKHLELENHIPDGPAVAFVRPHDIVLSRADEPAKNDDVRLPGTALVRFISLGQRAIIELLYEKSFIEAEMTREAIKELGLKTGTKCTISLRHPRVFARHEAEEQTRVAERTAMRPRTRRRFRDRLANLR
jgi:sulfate/thiosulfate transport system ATP-binding protein